MWSCIYFLFYWMPWPIEGTFSSRLLSKGVCQKLLPLLSDAATGSSNIDWLPRNLMIIEPSKASLSVLESLKIWVFAHNCLSALKCFMYCDLQFQLLYFLKRKSPFMDFNLGIIWNIWRAYNRSTGQLSLKKWEILHSTKTRRLRRHIQDCMKLLSKLYLQLF